MPTPARERLIDVSGLEPPEPLERILAALEDLDEGEYVHMLHRREPLLLYPELERRGFHHLTIFDQQYACEVFIWRDGDEVAGTACQKIGAPR